MSGEPVRLGRAAGLPAVAANDSALPVPLAPVAATTGHHRRLPALRLLSFIVVVLLPTIAAAVYYGAIAAPQYVVEFRFGLRSVAPPRTDAAGRAQEGAAMAEAGFDSYAVVQYLTSRSVIDDLGPTLDLRAMFTRPEADWLARLRRGASIEQLVEYWKGQIDAFFDPVDGTVTVRVRAFTRDDSLALADAIEAACERLVNGLSERARGDALGHSEEDVVDAEQRLTAALHNLTAFRDRHGVVDPQAAASARLALAGQLRSQIADAEAQLSVLRNYLRGDAPPVRLLMQRVAALESQERGLEAEVTPAAPAAVPALSAVIGDYDALQAEKSFAEGAYRSALEARDRARADADRQHIYLALFVKPSRPQEALYPRGLRSTGVVLLVAFAVWAIGGLVIHSIRDHL
jgi:capsular polysaccharide transport system permease protein